MRNAVKTFMRHALIALLIFCVGFASGCLFNSRRSSSNQAGVAPNVGGYDAASERIENISGTIESAAGNVREAAGEIRISIDEVGRIGSVAGSITDGIDSAFDGSIGIENGIQRVMGILDAAEKRNAEMETDRGSGLD